MSTARFLEPDRVDHRPLFRPELDELRALQVSARDVPR
jgi:hypothetical protein